METHHFKCSQDGKYIILVYTHTTKTVTEVQVEEKKEVIDLPKKEEKKEESQAVKEEEK